MFPSSCKPQLEAQRGGLSNSHKKSPLFEEAWLFVFAFFLTRRNASQSGEGKKECEEKRFTAHGVPKCV
ncbi:hypothetical protein BSQ40_26490 [Serratia fonticola]|nr:hypothetical protein BSQ40_26490 [Serratia fonticola]